MKKMNDKLINHCFAGLYILLGVIFMIFPMGMEIEKRLLNVGVIWIFLSSILSYIYLNKSQFCNKFILLLLSNIYTFSVIKFTNLFRVELENLVTLLCIIVLIIELVLFIGKMSEKKNKEAEYYFKVLFGVFVMFLIQIVLVFIDEMENLAICLCAGILLAFWVLLSVHEKMDKEFRRGKYARIQEHPTNTHIPFTVVASVIISILLAFIPHAKEFDKNLEKSIQNNRSPEIIDSALILTGDVEKYVQVTLDFLIKGGTKEYVDMVGVPEEEATIAYINTYDSTLEQFADDVDEAHLEEIRGVYEELHRNARYTITDTIRNDEGFFEVYVEVEPIYFEEEFNKKLSEGKSSINLLIEEKNKAGEEVSNEEIESMNFQIVMECINENLEQISYGEKEELIVTVYRDESNTYTVIKEDIKLVYTTCFQ